MDKEKRNLDVVGISMIIGWLVVALINVIALDPRGLWIFLVLALIFTLVMKTRKISNPEQRSLMDNIAKTVQKWDFRNFRRATKRNLLIFCSGVLGLWLWFLSDRFGYWGYGNNNWIVLSIVCGLILTSICLQIFEIAKYRRIIKYSGNPNNIHDTESKNDDHDKIDGKIEISYKRTAKLYNIMEFDQKSGQIVFIRKKQIVNIRDITSIRLEVNQKTVYSSGIIESIAGGVLFGGQGAIAGGLLSARPKTVDKAVLYIDTTLASCAGIAIRTTPVKGYEVCRTIELMRETYLKSEGSTTL
jgi:hypothetical protein